MIDTYTSLDETRLNDFRPSYTDLLIQHYSQEFGWDIDFTRLVLRDAVRFMTLCAITPDDAAESRVMVCSPIVDKIVDALLLDTPLLLWLEYHVFGGVRLVHEPAYAHRTYNQLINDMRYEHTVSLMQAAFGSIDRDVIWPCRLPVGYQTCTCGNDTKDCTWGKV